MLKEDVLLRAYPEGGFELGVVRHHVIPRHVGRTRRGREKASQHVSVKRKGCVCVINVIFTLIC